jgi:uncharacterized protein (DUF58 family)
MNSGIRLAGWFVVCALAWGYAQWRDSESGWFLFYGSAAIGLYVIAVYGLTLRSLQVQRRIRRSGWEEGEPVEVTLHMQTRSILPMCWGIVRDLCYAEGASEPIAHQQFRFAPAGWNRFEFAYRLEGLPRGRYRFGPTGLVTGDLFGLVTKTKWAEDETAFDVYPKPLDPGPLLVSAGGGLSAPVAGGGWGRAGVEPAGTVREYVRGDPYNRIHWRSSARTGEWKTLVPEPEGQPLVWIVLDAGAYPRYEDGEKDAGTSFLAANLGSMPDERASGFETAVRLAAGLMQRAADQGREAMLLIAGDMPQTVRLAGNRGRREALRLLAGVRPGGWEPAGEQARALERAAARMRSGDSVVCVSAACCEDWSAFIRRILSRRVRCDLLLATPESALMPFERRAVNELAKLGCGVRYYPDGRAQQRDGEGGMRYA